MSFDESSSVLSLTFILGKIGTIQIGPEVAISMFERTARHAVNVCVLVPSLR